MIIIKKTKNKALWQKQPGVLFFKCINLNILSLCHKWRKIESTEGKKLFIYYWRLTKLILIISSLLNCNNCKTPAKQKTTLDRIKVELQQELHPDGQQRVYKVPYSINKLLLPKLCNLELNNVDKFTQSYRKFNITAEQVEAKDFFLELVQNTPINIVVHPEVAGKISLSLKNVNIHEVLEEVQKIYGFGFEQSEQAIRIFPVALQTRVFKVNYLDLIRSGSSGTNVNFSKISDSGGSSNGSGGKTSGNNQNNGNNFGSNSGNSGGNQNNSGNSSGGTSISTSHSSNVWEQLKVTIEAILGIDDKKSQDSDKKSPNKNVAISPTTGMIIVTAYPNELEKIAQFLEHAESSLNKQVMLEAKVLEVDLKDGYRSGINWALLNKHMNLGQIASGGSTGEKDIGVTDQVESADINSIANTVNLIDAAQNNKLPQLYGSENLKPFGGLFTLGVNYHKLAAFVELLSAQGNVQVLSSPRITTSNNQKAIIKVGKDQFFVTGVTANQNTNTLASLTGAATTGSAAPTVTLTPFFSGIALDVTPQIGDDEITLHIHPIISDIDEGKAQNLPGYPEKVSLALSSIRESDSIIRAQNGQLIIIGGLMKDKTAEIITGVPFFKDIPFLGNFFRHTRQQAAKSELVILLRPIILDNSKMKQQLRKSYSRLDDLDRGFHVGGGNTWYGNLGEFQE